MQPTSPAPHPVRDDRVMATTKWVSGVIVPVLTAAFVILYLFPGETMRLWAWMVCPHMSAYVLGSGYLAGAYLFTRVARTREWHRVGAGFVATTVFATILLGVTVEHWDVFTHSHVSFWAWLALYVVTPVLLPVLWWNNRKADPVKPAPGDVLVPRGLRTAVGIGGVLQLAFAAAMLVWPTTIARSWPWAIDAATLRALSAFVAFPAVTWFLFLFEARWSCFRITQHVATIGFALILVGALQSSREFRPGWFGPYVAGLVTGLALNVALSVAMDRRARRARRVLTTPVEPAASAEASVLVGAR
jgi:hypothetical protein